MSTYPYPSLLPLLKFHCSTDEYTRVMQSKDLKDETWFPRYIAILPWYVYARCPFCDTDCIEYVDTYSLLEWDYIHNELSETIGHALRYYRRFYHGDSPDPVLKCLYHAESRRPLLKRLYCSHFLGVQEFLNLHGLMPHEVMDISSQTGEVPYVTPKLLKRRIRAYAVIHALPICRVEGSEFLPSYTLFCLTYFSESPDELRSHVSASEPRYGDYDPEYYGSFTAFPGDSAVPKQYDLGYWARSGWLGWLDFAESDLPLRVGRGLQLPEMYQDIKGARQSYLWRNGKMHYRT